ncbi:MAG: hypothetical protein ACUVR3_03705 [Candidatus Roseilinea sp.]|uniref:hypothetical protein n=1 Tax=Candidatus Roseilinea sp. TaxID=2838777 RepID=UPI004049E1AE
MKKKQDFSLIEHCCLDAALEAGADFLDHASYWADIYSLPDGGIAFFCRDCGRRIKNADFGCEHCGFGCEVKK